MTTTPAPSVGQEALNDLGEAFGGAATALIERSASPAEAIRVVVNINRALARADEFLMALRPWLDAAAPGPTVLRELGDRQARLTAGSAEVSELRRVLDQLMESDVGLRAQAEELSRLQGEIEELRRIESAAVDLDQIRALRDQLAHRTAQVARQVKEAEDGLARAAEDVVIVASTELEHVRLGTRELLRTAAEADARLSSELLRRRGERERLTAEHERLKADLTDVNTRIESERAGFEQANQELSERIKQLRGWEAANRQLRSQVQEATTAVGDRLDNVVRELEDTDRALREALVASEQKWREDRAERGVNPSGPPASGRGAEG